jgi:acyl dehydratase
MIDPHKLLNWPFPEIEHRLTKRDAILYALGVGFGDDPLDRKQLRFVYEENLQAVPSMASILCFPGNWLRNPDTGVDYRKQLNAGNRIVLHAPLPTEGTLVCRPRVTDVIDKGAGRGALIVTERKIFDKGTGSAVCTVTTTSLCRADGGFGGPARTLDAAVTMPDTAPDCSATLEVAKNLALIYRLNGDQNPLHVDPDAARAAGYPQPILHGLATLGVVTHALLKACCDYDTARLKSIEVRYTAPVIPGDSLRTDVWRSGDGVLFRTVAVARGAIVIDGGHALISGT